MHLKKIAKTNKWFHLIKKSKFGGISLVVLDTVDNLRDAKSVLKDYQKLPYKHPNFIGCWVIKGER